MMEKMYVKIEYKGKVYKSDVVEMTTDQVLGVKYSIEKAVSGQANFFSIKQKNAVLYFGPKILKKSVITLTEVN